MWRPDRSSGPATYEDLLRVPDHLVAEIVDGDLYATPRPAPRHSAATVALTSTLHAPFDAGRGGPGGWRILFEPELHLERDVLVPDVAAWQRERLPRIPDEAFISLRPDWVCEVISPSTAALDRVRKLARYGREGVTYAWLVEPIARTLEVLKLDAPRWTILGTFEGGAVVRAEPFDALEFDLAALWTD